MAAINEEKWSLAANENRRKRQPAKAKKASECLKYRRESENGVIGKREMAL